jgi:hypothetical protein
VVSAILLTPRTLARRPVVSPAVPVSDVAVPDVAAPSGAAVASVAAARPVEGAA